MINYSRDRQLKVLRLAIANRHGGNRAPLKLRNEPEEFFTEPRKTPAKVTLPRVKWLERPDP
jgi:hypothetical protein